MAALDDFRLFDERSQSGWGIAKVTPAIEQSHGRLPLLRREQPLNFSIGVRQSAQWRHFLHASLRQGK